MIKKTVLAVLLATGTFIGCQENTTDLVLNEQTGVDMSDFYLHTDQDEAKSNSKNQNSVTLCKF